MGFEAKYGGSCAADCGERIRPGQLVTYVDDELVHEACALDQVPVERAPKEVCKVCWLEKPCVCEET